LDEVVLAVVEAEFATFDVELGTKDDREVLAVPAPDELEEILLQPCKQCLRTGLFPISLRAMTYQGIKCCPICCSH
jgi:hypothetical protein